MRADGPVGYGIEAKKRRKRDRPARLWMENARNKRGQQDTD